jgi:uncharacterized protein
MPTIRVTEVALPGRRPLNEFLGAGLAEVAAVPFDACFHTFILKVQRDCNLDCDYCYVYHMADQSWRQKPGLMSPPVVKALAERIQEHVVKHQPSKIDIVFHGGEPLLGGVPYLVEIKRAIEAVLSPGVASFGMQTNGVLLSIPVLDTLLREKIGFGISLDGPREVNDLHRVSRGGRQGSHERVIAALSNIAQHPAKELFSGYLAVIQVDYPPEALIEYFASIGAQRLDLLLPHGDWDSLPPGMAYPEEGKYGRWLIQAFDCWFDRFPHIRLRFFSDLLKLFFSGQNVVESLGLGAKSIVVVETDGAIEGLDTLRAVKEGATDIGLNVLSHPFDEALSHPAVLSRYLGEDALGQLCRECRYKNVCGGGYLPHRYSHSLGYLNPSVYCKDLFDLCQHVAKRLGEEIGHVLPVPGE